MRVKKEIIKLDAIIVDVIEPSVFVSELSHGHRLVTIPRERRGGRAGRMAGLKIGDRVSVEVAPGDFSTGWIVGG